MSAIVERNRDVEHIVNAAAGVGVYGHGEKKPKRFAMLISTDIHRCAKQMQSAVDYLNAMDALDCGICLGDIQGANYTENDASWYYLAVNSSKKPFFTTIGNHDNGNNTKKELCGTKAEVLEKFIRTTRGKIGLPNIDKTYYSVNFDEYKITLIVMDNYMAPEDRDENGNFVIHRGAECLNQEQVDWLVDTLAAVPQDYQVVVARHGYPDKGVKLEGNWTQERGGLDKEMVLYGESELVPDVINAWTKGEKLVKEYAPIEAFSYLPTLTVNADFTARGEGVFVTYIIGHVHRDIIAKSAVYPDQNIITFAASANDDWQNYGCDLPRERDTKAEDCLTVMAVDSGKRRIHLVRVGSNITTDLVERTHFTLTY
ncbi:MAG: metallophosphoesterase [Clostridia bacterium]|nr:metallophosphoesterase [Clostridia bacterium]